VQAATASDDMSLFEPGKKPKEYRLLIHPDDAAELEQICRIRNEANKRVGATERYSVTKLLDEAYKVFRDWQFGEWGGKPKDQAAEAKIVEELVKTPSTDTTKTKKR
jgi:hypothetical protein